jgi:hypothetical protein
VKYLGGRPGVGTRLFGIGIVLSAMLLAAVPASANNAADYAIGSGWFYTQTGGGSGQGYAVQDTGTDSNGHAIKFWSEFKRFGGVATLGYPVGEPYAGSDGFTYQPFQRAVLQWRPELGQSELSNTFEILEAAGQDNWLASAKGIPQPIMDDGSAGNYQKAVTTRLSWLTNSQIKATFLSNPNPSAISGWNQDMAIQMYGLPMSQPQQNGPFISQRFQRIAFQLWTDNVSGMPSPGTVVGVLGGDLFKEAGQIPAGAVQPLGPGGSAPIQPIAPAPTPIPVATPVPTPAPPPASSYSWYNNGYQTFPNCGTTYMYGYTRNSSGNAVGGMTIHSWNDYSGNDNYVSTDSNGRWTRVIHAGPQAGKWYVALVDGSHNQASDIVTVNFTSNCAANSGPVQEVEVDFQSH